ncbi:MAG: adenylosuccinate lyase family protein, partial [Actinomycetota bacterium]|nr:adenylosuccinate lyase family protein [Actinomycetota bacterium]
MMGSALYGHLWSTPESAALFSDEARTQAWLDILAALAAAQAELGLVPAAAAADIADKADVDLLDLQRVGARTRATGHSTLGLIQVLAEVLPPRSREWVYYGATVQDVTDTWTGLVMQRIGRFVFDDLRRAEAALLDLAAGHRDTIMVGRTHGQPGLPITFGFKTAVWAAEVRRHLDRLAQAHCRWSVGQLAGAVGTGSFWGADALELQARFCARLGLSPPDMTWLTARDRIAEFCALLAMVTGTVARIGHEVRTLQRPEIGEVAEAAPAGVVGSITMPHKRNPERSEHLGTLSRVVRSSADLALEGMVCEHERDGTAWKTEWELLPRACTAAAACVASGAELVAGLRVDTDRMASNLREQRGYVMSEPVMRALAGDVGKHTAAELVHRAARAGLERGQGFREALAADE